MGEWIDINTYEPDRPGRYLCVISDIFQLEEELYESNYIDVLYYNGEYFCRDTKDLFDVTHWMPLPEFQVLK